MKKLLVLLLVCSTTLLLAQDYVMYETHYMTPKAGHMEQLMEEIGEHNKLFHADGPYYNAVFTVINGPRAGDLFFAMGPMTFTQNDDRPSSAEHGADWSQVESLTEGISNVEYWVRNDELSYVPETTDDTQMDLSRVRFFEVADNALFVKVQKQIISNIKAMGSKRARTMYRKQFMNRDGRDWAAVGWYKNWAELDDDSLPGFEETFIKTRGEAAWKMFEEDFEKAVVSREDEWRMILRDIMGGGEDED